MLLRSEMSLLQAAVLLYRTVLYVDNVSEYMWPPPLILILIYVQVCRGSD
jgi:hypothetical protein